MTNSVQNQDAHKLAVQELVELVSHSRAVDAETRLEEVQRIFLESSHAYLAVIEDGKVAGICSRVHVGSLMSSKYGFSLYGRQPVKAHLQPNALTLPISTPLMEVLHSDLCSNGKPFADDLVLVHSNGSLAGLVAMEKISKLQTRLLKANIQEISQARDAALESTRLKSIFLATVSHELRTPMNGIIGMSSLLLETQMDENQQELARTVNRCSEDLLLILNDLLDFSKIEARRLRLELATFRPAETIREAFEIASIRGKSRGLSMFCNDMSGLPEEALGDPGRIRQILANLLNNAIKFTERGSVSLHASVEHRRGANIGLRIAVTDTGIGIPMGEQGRLFQPFVQADGTSTRKHGGTGLGLAIVRELAELMSGEAGLSSEPGVGSTFWVRIILGESQERPGATERKLAAAEGPPLAPMNVLLAEDNPVNRAVALRFLQKLGCTTTVAVNGLEAVKASQEAIFDAILMDCQMPELDGLEATKEIRRLETARHSDNCPIIALTANSMPEDERRCLQAGMNDFLTKPLKLEPLRAALHRTSPDRAKQPALSIGA